MAGIDPKKERERLAKNYAGLPDLALRELAADPDSLTDIARQVLQSEIERRALAVQVSPDPQSHLPQPIPPPADPSRRILLRQFRDLPEASMALSLLKSAGIDCSLEDDNVVRLDWFWSNAVGGIKLYVGEADAPSAAEILDSPPPENFDIGELGTYQQPSCPRCGSLDISYNELDRPVAYSTLIVGIPIPWTRRGWRCHACENRWVENPPAPRPPA